MSFEEIALTRHAGERVYLKSLSPDRETDSEFYIVPMKYDRDTANRIRSITYRILKRYNIEPDPKRTDDEIRDLMTAKMKTGVIEGTEKDMDDLALIAWTKGVHEHNLDYNKKPNQDKGELIPTDDKGFAFLKKFDVTLREIVDIVKEFNDKLDKMFAKDEGKKNENSRTPSTGDSTE